MQAQRLQRNRTVLLDQQISLGERRAVRKLGQGEAELFDDRHAGIVDIVVAPQLA